MAMDGALTTGMYAWYTPIRSGGRARMVAVQRFFCCSGPAACSLRLPGQKDQACAPCIQASTAAPSMGP